MDRLNVISTEAYGSCFGGFLYSAEKAASELCLEEVELPHLRILLAKAGCSREAIRALLQNEVGKFATARGESFPGFWSKIRCLLYAFEHGETGRLIDEESRNNFSPLGTLIGQIMPSNDSYAHSVLSLVQCLANEFPETLDVLDKTGNSVLHHAATAFYIDFISDRDDDMERTSDMNRAVSENSLGPIGSDNPASLQALADLLQGIMPTSTDVGYNTLHMCPNGETRDPDIHDIQFGGYNMNGEVFEDFDGETIMPEPSVHGGDEQFKCLSRGGRQKALTKNEEGDTVLSLLLKNKGRFPTGKAAVRIQLALEECPELCLETDSSGKIPLLYAMGLVG